MRIHLKKIAHLNYSYIASMNESIYFKNFICFKMTILGKKDV